MSEGSGDQALLLDTHVWIRYINGDAKLGASAIHMIDSARMSGRAFVSVITVWEIAMLVRKKRLHLPVPVSGWVEQALRLPGIRLTPLTPLIAIESAGLPDTLNRDPADRILVATARIENMRLMSRDKDILRFAKQTQLPTEKA